MCPIISSDIESRLSGGAANADVDASLGGAKSSVEVVDDSLHNLFDRVTGAESDAGDVEYRCIYIHNAHGSLTLQGAAIYIETNTPSDDSDIEIGLGTAAIDAEEQTVGDEDTAPSGVSFSSAAGEGNKLTIGDLAPGSHKAIWIKRTIDASATAVAADSVILKVVGDTDA